MVLMGAKAVYIHRTVGFAPWFWTISYLEKRMLWIRWYLVAVSITQHLWETG